jgi:hypothetical protein
MLEAIKPPILLPTKHNIIEAIIALVQEHQKQGISIDYDNIINTVKQDPKATKTDIDELQNLLYQLRDNPKV